MHYSQIQILKVDTPEEKTGKDGNKYTVRAAQTALLDDHGNLQKVGRLKIPDAMIEKVKVGVFRAAFTLGIATYGLNKGDVIAVLADLLPLDVLSARIKSAVV